MIRARVCDGVDGLAARFLRLSLPEEQLKVGEWMLAAGAQAMRLLALSYADTRRPI
jgi:hypothetical protein